MAKTLQETMIEILGSQDWKCMDGLSISSIQRATELLKNPDYSLQTVREAVDLLQRYTWFRKAKIKVGPPWGELPWDELAQIAPWETKSERSKRLKEEKQKENKTGYTQGDIF